MTIQEIAVICKQRRLELGLSQRQLADKIKVLRFRISEFENGKSNLQFDGLSKLLDALDLDISIVTKI